MKQRALDTITLSNLSLHLPQGLGPSAFGLTPPPPCPANLTLKIHLDDAVVPSCVEDDTMGGLGVNYSSISKEIIRIVSLQEGGVWKGPEEILKRVVRVPLEMEVVKKVDAALSLPKASLAAQSIVYSATFDMGRGEGYDWKCLVDNVRVRTIVGLHPHERRTRQWLEVDVGVAGYTSTWDYRTASESVFEWLEASSYGTIEAVVDELARHVLDSLLHDAQDPSVTVTLRKPSALPYACPEITINRTRSDISGSAAAAAASTSLAQDPSSKRVFIALGSNLGDRVHNVSRALSDLQAQPGIKFVQTSRLYESEPMYVEDQDRFINGVVELSTSISPLDLLRVLKRIEREVGRVKTFRNGPRVVDLDLVFYGDEVVNIGQVDEPEDEYGVGWLQCPHPRLAEREFVLRPLADFAGSFVDPLSRKTVGYLLETLMASSKPSLAPVLPFKLPAKPLRLDGTPKIMQIFNATPDSFSDGNVANLDPRLALERVKELFSTPHPPAILDIGGMSTRPGSLPCSEEEEVQRVVPLIKAIRSILPEDPLYAVLSSIPISVDTYRPSVALEAIKAGASCINDVRGGAEDGMPRAMAEADVPVIIMHSRGDSISMAGGDAQNYDQQGGTLPGVRSELASRVQKALEAGVKRWNVILDPGLGFAKSYEGNLELTRSISTLTEPGDDTLQGLPILIGGSRKGFVGKAIARENKAEANLRGYGDAALVSWCCASGVVDFVRVHDGRGMAEVVSMWKAIAGE